MDKLLYFPTVDQFGQSTSELLYDSSGDMVKTASSFGYSDSVKDFLSGMKPELDKYLYMLVHALGAGEVWGANVNGDYFPEKYLKHSGPEFGHKTFESHAKLYKHHVNKDPQKSYGEVLHSCYDEDMRRVLLVVAVDRSKAPDICYKIEQEGEFPDVSMGCRVPYDICSICGHKAKSPKQYCSHAKEQMGQIYPDGRKVYVINPFPRFFDISHVFIGAEKPAKFLHKINESDMGGSAVKVASSNRIFNLGYEKIASEVLLLPSAILAEKVGYSVKESEMIKEIPAGETGLEGKKSVVMSGLAKLRASEKPVGPQVTKSLCQHPLKKVLTTLTSKGISLSPSEFQKIVLIKMGQEKLANLLEERNIEFEITDRMLDIEPMDFDKSDIDPEVEKIAQKLMPERSDLQPYLFERTMKLANQKEHPNIFYEPSRTNVAPGMATVAGLYMAYKKGLLKSLGPLNDAMEFFADTVGIKDMKNPAMIIPLAAAAAATIQGTKGLLREHGKPELIANSDMLKLSSVRNLALLGGSFAAPYVAREHVRQKAMRGEQPGTAGRLAYKYPHVMATAGVLAAPSIARKMDQLKKVLGKAPILGNMLKLSNKKNVTIDDWIGDNQDWRHLFDNVVKNEFWATGKLAHEVGSGVSTVATVLGLATAGSMEE